MATSRSQRQVIEDLTRTYGPEVAAAFDEAMRDLRSRAEVRRVVEALSRGDIEAALRALHIDEAVFERLTEALAQAKAEGGRSAVEFMPRRAPDGTALIIRHRPGDPVAAYWLREHSARLVSRITGEVRDVIRDQLAEAMQAGRPPQAAAIEIVGRVNRATGRREGGVLGLTDPQAQAVRRAREELASTDPTALRSYLTRGRRDRRFDRTVERAIRDGTPIPTETRRRMIRAYESRLLELRGQVIGRTEAMTALQRGANEAWRQAIADGKVDVQAVTKVWHATRDLRTRDTHAILHGTSVGFNEPFVTARGAQMMHPMDTSLGAGAEEIINCRCWCEYRVDAFYNFRRAA